MFVVLTVSTADAFFNSALDVIIRHIVCFSFFDSQFQSCIVLRQSAAFARSYRDAFGMFGKSGSSFAVHLVFLAFNVVYTSHKNLSFLFSELCKEHLINSTS